MKNLLTWVLKIAPGLRAPRRSKSNTQISSTSQLANTTLFTFTKSNAQSMCLWGGYKVERGVLRANCVTLELHLASQSDPQVVC